MLFSKKPNRRNCNNSRFAEEARNLQYKEPIQKIQQEVAGTLASYIDTFYLAENSFKIIESIPEGRPRNMGERSPLGPTL